LNSSETQDYYYSTVEMSKLFLEVILNGLILFG